MEYFRRAREERESRRKAMQERAKKGLLSEEEKVLLAELEAERAGHGLKGIGRGAVGGGAARNGEEEKECLVM